MSKGTIMNKHAVPSVAGMKYNMTKVIPVTTKHKAMATPGKIAKDMTTRQTLSRNLAIYIDLHRESERSGDYKILMDAL
jgi:hypothetical protein